MLKKIWNAWTFKLYQKIFFNHVQMHVDEALINQSKQVRKRIQELEDTIAQQRIMHTKQINEVRKIIEDHIENT